MIWHDINIEKPEFLEEVLVWVDGHRDPAWSNNYALVAFFNVNGKFYQVGESYTIVVGVTHWSKIEKPIN